MENEITDAQLLDTLQLANLHYRAGTPTISDAEYDALIAELVRRNPEHPFLHTVEPEPVAGKTIRLPKPMLSTQKAYTLAELKKWYADAKAASELLLYTSDVEVRATPKLDGFAAQVWGENQEYMATRGDGVTGQDIRVAVDRGVQRTRITGAGEIVVRKDYFEEHLVGEFENTRNVIAAAIKQGELHPKIAQALQEGAITFIPFQCLPGLTTNTFSEIEDQTLDDMWAELTDTPFETDGLVFELTNPVLKEYLGSTNHHHRWQIAYKRNTEFHECRVTGLTWQTAKTGRITPVVNLEPTRIGGVTVSKATGHHAGNVLNNGIATGAIVKVCRSGQVIPYIAEVIKPAHASWPDRCPSCNAPTSMEGDNLYCSNETACPAQIERTMEYFFKTIGVCDGFGPKIIEQLCSKGANSVSKIYAIDTWFLAEHCGFGEKTAFNLMSQINRSMREEIEDWRFLAAFSIPLVGKGGCEKLLTHYTLDEVFGLTVEQIVKIEDFAGKTAHTLVDALKRIKPEFDALYPRFKLRQTKTLEAKDSPIAGKTVVFTGTMVTGKRCDMEKQAKALGATVTSSVSAKTDYLVAGENVGANKTDAAKKHSVTVLTERQYLSLIQ